MITVVFFLRPLFFFHHHAACQAGKYCKQGAGGQWLDIDAPHVPQADRRGWKNQPERERPEKTWGAPFCCLGDLLGMKSYPSYVWIIVNY